MDLTHIFMYYLGVYEFLGKACATCHQIVPHTLWTKRGGIFLELKHSYSHIIFGLFRIFLCHLSSKCASFWHFFVGETHSHIWSSHFLSPGCASDIVTERGDFLENSEHPPPTPFLAHIIWQDLPSNWNPNVICRQSQFNDNTGTHNTMMEFDIPSLSENSYLPEDLFRVPNREGAKKAVIRTKSSITFFYPFP